MDKVLEVKSLTKLYKNGRGIVDVSFDIYPGDVYGFLGPNGAGKTTVMKTITGLCRADRGQVKIFGFDITEQFESAMDKVGCIIENPVPYSYLSAYKNLQLAARFYPQIEKTRIDEIIELVGLKDFKNEMVSNYSTGMKQRLGVAGALLSHPQLLILDEPTNGLDIEGMADIRKLIVQLAKEQGVTFFVSSHLAHEMELICNRVGIINNGKLIVEGIVPELLKTHASLEDFFIEAARDDRRKLVNE